MPGGSDDGAVYLWYFGWHIVCGCHEKDNVSWQAYALCDGTAQLSVPLCKECVSFDVGQGERLYPEGFYGDFHRDVNYLVFADLRRQAQCGGGFR